jgi:hypothetical protein
MADIPSSVQPQAISNHSSNTQHPLLKWQTRLVTGSHVPSSSSTNQYSGLGPGLGAASAQINMSNATRRRQEAERAALRIRVRKDILRQQNELRRHKEYLKKSKLWEEQIIPYWDQMVYTAKVRDLCIKGIPPTIRAKVWPLLVGNDLEVSD